MAEDIAARTEVCSVLRDSGEKERMKEYLRVKLIECGWHDDMDRWCKEQITKKTEGMTPGRPHPAGSAPPTLDGYGITPDWIEKEVMPHAMATIPDYIKADVLMWIRKFMMKKDTSITAK